MTIEYSNDTPFQCFQIDENDGVISGKVVSRTIAELPDDGDVLIHAHYSNVNYKDALAATGKGKIIRKFPLIGGIDVSGKVVQTDDPRFQIGDAVVVNGCGLGEIHDGGYSEFVRVPGDWVVPLPGNLTLRESMILGTAGFTAAMAIEKMEQNGQRPDLGTIAVSGASGGVGSLAIPMLKQCGYSVCALTGKKEAGNFLQSLGADEVLFRDEIDFGTRPLEKTRFAGAIDNLGGDTLAWFSRVVGPNGNIASIGLAASPELSTTVMPFILRGINLLGINSVNMPYEKRVSIWNRLGSDLKPNTLDAIATRTVSLDKLGEVFDGYIDATITGKTIVNLCRD